MTNLGCSEYLNSEACLSQLTDGQNQRVQCIFHKRCKEVKKVELIQYGCSAMFNIFACLDVEKQSCSWQNNICQPLNQSKQDNSNFCNIFKMPVNPFTCSQLPYGLCMSSGYEGNFECVEIPLYQLSQLSCYELGLNEEGCLAINKLNQYCIFQDNKCTEIQLSEIKSCEDKFYQSLCLSIKNPDTKCEWVDKKCRQFEYNAEVECTTKNMVNASVCQMLAGSCYYDESKHICMNVTNKIMNSLKCDTPGLSKQACLSITNFNCSFKAGRCQELSKIDLYSYQCHMQLNKQACVNLQTPFQYCFWTGSYCERRVVNQDYDCPLNFNDQRIRVNGNVCQAISKYKTKCKYSQQTNLCIESSTTDTCDTLFINKFGCLSIIKEDVACQWKDQGCKEVKVIQHQTTCDSLRSANPIACSQVLDQNENLGCYFDEVKQLCATLSVQLDPRATKQEVQQYLKDQELLRTIVCQNASLGLNRISCSSITTKDVGCRWFRNQCVQVKNQKEIQKVPCLNLQYANQKACSYIIYGGEVCRYNQTIKGCTNSIIPHMQCNELGLNSFGCSKAEGKCQYINDQCQSSNFQTPGDEEQSSIVQDTPIKCGTTSPTRNACLSFMSNSLLCQWKKGSDICADVEIKENQYCLDYAGTDILVNSNVCASIICDFPDYNFYKGVQVDKNRGYCQYNKQTAQCTIKKVFCKTNCCTETENIGINAHSCSKFSTTEPGVYCYFMDLICQELSNDIVDISNSDQVKLYYNENHLPCTSMNINSCHMIEWSVGQRCYHNGIICLNINYIYIKDNRELTKEPSILNKNACFAIDGQITELNTLKYVGYDEENKRCLEILEDPQYASCEQTQGNRNVCQRYNGNNYCRWNSNEIKCVTIPLDEYNDIQDCDENLNVKACTDIKNNICIFSYKTDKCIRATEFNVDCNHYEQLGSVSKQVCEQINKIGQSCQFDNYTCVDSTLISESCDGSSANNRSCFKNTKGQCRWDPNTFQCYVNYTKIEELSCLDLINIELCKLVTKETCFWNDVTNQCEIFNTISAADFEILNNTGNHKFTEKGCLLITGDAYYYDQLSQKCSKLLTKTADCNAYQMNKYACLYYTQSHNCFYDEEEVLPNNKCKPFVQDQSKCSTQWQINIEVCMNIQQTCMFDVSTLQCQPFKYEDSMTCSKLSNYSFNLQHPNRRVCASVAQTLDQTSGGQLCSEDRENIMKCKFEKYCFWMNYSCQIFNIVYDYIESAYGQQQLLKECPDFEKYDNCFDDIMKNTTSYRLTKQSKIESTWSQLNDTCHQKIIKYTREHLYSQKSNNNITVCKIIECSFIEQIFCNINAIFETIFTINENTPDNYDTSKIDTMVSSDPLDTCQNFDCSSQSENTCQTQITQPYNQIRQNNCIVQDTHIFNNWCSLMENKVNICDKDFDKALCLELSPHCYFDLQQGGCKQLKGNEHNIGDCSQIANNCYVSSSPKAICQNGESSIKPGDKCKTVQKPYLTCVPLTTYNQPFSCAAIKNQDVQPILCAKANDDCRYDGNQCIHEMPTQMENGLYPCDRSFSQSLCEKCGCNYTFQGQCQQFKQVPLVDPDKSNKDFLCYQVNLLETTNKQEICVSVDQACAFSESICEDATHYECNQLFENPVSSKACLKCYEHATKYDASQQKCLNIDDIPNQNSCSYLNQLACLKKTKGIKCKWDNFECKTVSIDPEDKIECSILNYNACYSKQINICWIDQITSLCVYYNENMGKCELLQTESLCLRSMYGSCQWTNEKCIQISKIPANTCDNLNQYSCLNTINIACGWSTKYEKCFKLEFKLNPLLQCNDILQSDIDRFNTYTCTEFKTQSGCLHDQYYNCREIIPTDVLSCEVSSIYNVNEYACTKLTKGQCIFVNRVCQQTTNTKLGCLTNLNEKACLKQEDACKFDNYCQPHVIKSQNDINTPFFYTKKSCDEADFSVMSPDGDRYIGVSIIFNEEQQKCIDITNKNIQIKDCTYKGINKYACLTKTSQYCEFAENQCRPIQFKAIYAQNKCVTTLNQYTCTRLNTQCKFVNYQCLPISVKDNCITLSSEKSVVQNNICENDREAPCMFNYSTQNCEIITTPQKCEGLNRWGCLFHTQGSYCEIKNQKCIKSFGNRNCLDEINYDKCLSIITKGQMCYFDPKLGCRNIDTTKVDLNICDKNGLSTSPTTCSKSTDVPCAFNKLNKQCAQYPFVSEYQINDSISNISSFNKMTCQIFNKSKPLMWQESCQIVSSSQFLYLKCNAPLNQIACLSIKTPYQFCQYKNNQCINANLDDFKNVKCNTIENINSGAFCAINTLGTACKFDKYLFKCQEIEDKSIVCVEKDPEEKGINKKGCELDTDRCIYDENCYKKNNSGYQFCRDIKKNGQFQCKEVTGEGCMIQSGNCVKIYYNDYSKIKCEQALNRFGCVNIQTEGQYCQFVGDQCKSQDISQFKDNTCLSIININNYKFCEQAQDIACTFDLKNNLCRNVYPQEEFSCERGLNKIACLNQTNKSLMCKFLQYCYGPNNGIMNCAYKDKQRCCKEAGSIDTCLNQKIYECEWTANNCQALQNKVEECDQIVNASFLVCASIKQILCVFVPTEYRCKAQSPTTCGFSQSSQQCKRMKYLSCMWNSEDESCSYSEESTYLGCQQVSERSGNQRACMNVEVQGQLCIYKDEQCLLFVQDEDVNNCLDTINKNACIQQTVSDCQWVEQVFSVTKSQNQNLEDIIQGECKPITNLDQTSCSANISYTACLKIIKNGEHCIWKDLRCQTISQQELYTPEELIFVNINACGLVNNGDTVGYDQEFKYCRKIINPNELSCKPQVLGINKDACLAIKTQSCIWNSIASRCQYQDIQIDTQQLNIQNLNIISCSKLDINQPYGYSLKGCQDVDINSITCTHDGLNKFACLNIKNHPCIWKQNVQDGNYYCYDYTPYTLCELIPINVNSKVCQLVDLDACYYDINNNKCENVKLQTTNCDTVGLNPLGCIKIDDCVFQEYCQRVTKQFYDCNEYPIANYKVCMNAIDSCKFNELTSGCSQAKEELCETKGLSMQGCQSSQCTWINNQCQCNSIKEYDCNQIKTQKQCDSLSHCKYDKVQNQCRWKQCEDQPASSCDGLEFHQFYCYTDTSQLCKSAEQCEDIKSPNSQNCPQLHDKLCIFNSELNQCQTLNCEILEEQQCLSYPNYCIFSQTCKFLGCNYTTQFNCACRYLPNTPQCNGVQVNDQFCVELTDSTCVSCEEISSPCICHQNHQFCQYSFTEMKCQSKICKNFIEQQNCPEQYCDFLNQNCVQKCQYIQQQSQCESNDCIWSDNQCKLNEKTGNSTDIVVSSWGLIELVELSMLILNL
ncbi:unnamed protein product (macronuclear) [Paramecium tetraurelia]|uniref:Uncharacterized protein n=1 Tax=Paramecium tetraurelia TaxID=5888 RepID=A0C4K7_PARTE|nr:uncharacterized protein GSPATT00006223001 [Paramecium tetraurelia]CAK65724.1 unnamed protein product [Paramecium tetraurelia]|eukprot:XP_001433121.1 hypothetical protein (macronuclear) [Paramecium tetraurelia strain d4-2]